MKEEQLIRANAIVKEIDKIKQNIKNVKKVATTNEGEFDSGAYMRISGGGLSEHLIPDFLILPLKEFIIIYISRAEQKIKELEEEFEKL